MVILTEVSESESHWKECVDMVTTVRVTAPTYR